MNLANLIVTAVIGALLGIAGSITYFTPQLTELEEEVKMRPPVLVVDMAKLALDSVPIGSSKAAIEDHFRNTQGVIDKFSDAGFLILSRENIVSAPAHLMLKSEDFTKNKHVEGER